MALAPTFAGFCRYPRQGVIYCRFRNIFLVGMAALIPAYGTCAGRMTAGERRIAQRLESKLEDDPVLV